jgi:APA family basic amino acid/polyamine antiporter
LDANTQASTSAVAAQQVTLKRSLTVWHALLYGLGITIGAGIYVLIGPVAKTAGMAAPASFVLAALLMSLSAVSFAELATRMPVAAGEAAYVAEGFRSRIAGTGVGLLVIAISITTSAAISLGSAQYIRVFNAAPELLVVTAVVLLMGAIAAWGIVESVTFAAIMTIIETGGLLLIAILGFLFAPGAVTRLPEALPDLSQVAVWQTILSAGLLAVFAFIGFEGIVNVAEETKDPERNLPRAILATLVITTLIYVVVVWVSLVTLGPDTLGETEAPLANVFVRLTGWPATVMAAIAIVATLNGIIASIILAARVAYGLARRGDIPAVFARVNRMTRTPLVATLVTTLLVLGFALAVPLTGLAELSSRLTLAMFAAVNASLVAIKMRETRAPEHVFLAPLWVPIAGLTATIGFLIADLIAR